MDSLGAHSLRLEVILVNTFLSCSFKGHKGPAIFDCADQEAYRVHIYNARELFCLLNLPRLRINTHLGRIHGKSLIEIN